MSILKSLRIRRRKIGKRALEKTLQVRYSISFYKEFRLLRKKLLSLTGKKLTLAYIFREGGKMKLRQLRVQIEKAQRGQLHAKQRTNALRRH